MRTKLAETARKYSFRVPASLQKAIEARAFGEGREAKSPLISRLLLELKDAIARRKFTPPNLDDIEAPSGARTVTYELSATHEVKDFVERWRRRLRCRTNTLALNHLLGWAVSLPCAAEVKGAGETMDWLRSGWGETVAPIDLLTVLSRLTRHCCLADARANLLALARSKRIRLLALDDSTIPMVRFDRTHQYQLIQWCDPALPVLRWRRDFLTPLGSAARDLKSFPTEGLIEINKILALGLKLSAETTEEGSQIEILTTDKPGTAIIEELRQAAAQMGVLNPKGISGRRHWARQAIVRDAAGNAISLTPVR